MNRFGAALAIASTLAVSTLLGACKSGGGGTDEAPTTEDQTPAPQVSDLHFPYDVDYPVTDTAINNPAAYITAQCYTKTQDAEGGVHNPCYSCHHKPIEPNFIDDASLQLAYSFPAAALENHWTNLFKDRSAQVAAISDEAILHYVRTDNYLTDDGTLILANLLRNLPANWDLDGDGRWDGFVPDAWFDFDAEGFDHAPDGSYSGWRAFAYYPFLGTFWPTNGSTDDVLIRLDAPFQEDSAGHFDLETYKVNLAIAEALVKRRDITIDPVDENRWNVDLDKNGVLGNTDHIHYDWAPTEGRTMSFVGAALQLQASGEVNPSAGLFPKGTEFLHSVRYIDVKEDGTITLAARMKELRYARKATELPYYKLEQIAQQEGRERALDADVLRQVSGDMERGFYSQGWLYQGFIEDRNGDLRPQTAEENLFCMGCHSGLGTTTDTIFSFPRKLEDGAFQKGWYHWSQKGLAGLAEPLRSDGLPEYAHYLAENGAGDEFRDNDEVKGKFFDADGQLRADALERLSKDIGYLLDPSVERALANDKAYRVIVQEQSFTEGRDAHVAPVDNVHGEVTQGEETGIDQAATGSGLLR